MPSSREKDKIQSRIEGRCSINEEQNYTDNSSYKQASPSTLATSQMSPFGLEIESMTVIAYIYIVKSRDAYDSHEWN